MAKIEFPIRINKYLAVNNYATRREADLLIEKGLVFINNKKAILGDKVNEKDKVTLKNFKKEYVYYAYNKPVGISTNPEPKSKDIISINKFPIKVFPVGRLDKDSHGLIILTNDGRITDRLLSPKYVHDKEYQVKVEKNYSDKFLELIQNGIKLDNFTTRKCKALRIEGNVFNVVLTEGKKHQIRRMCEALHHKVIDLKRTRVMNINLGNIKDGQFREIKGAELKTLLTSLNIEKNTN